MRTPLNAIIGYSELLYEDMSSDGFDPHSEEARDDIHKIRHSATHLLGLIEDILAIGQLEGPQFGAEWAPSRLDELLDEVSAVVRPSLIERGYSLTFHSDEALPEVVPLDQKKIRHVLVNLLSSAGRRCSSAAIALYVRRAEDGDLLFEVVDDGEEIPTSQLDTIFEPFERVIDFNVLPTTGLSLTLAQQLVEVMGGEVAVTSDPEHTRFRVTLPSHH